MGTDIKVLCGVVGLFKLGSWFKNSASQLNATKIAAIAAGTYAVALGSMCYFQHT
jgi:hypothetical protein